MEQRSSLATPQALAQVRQHLVILFLIGLPLNVLVYWLASTQRSLELLPFLETAQLVVAIVYIITLYRAARRLGFGKTVIVISLILSIFIPLLELVLVVSAYIRLTKQLRAAGWKTGLWAAQPAT